MNRILRLWLVIKASPRSSAAAIATLCLLVHAIYHDPTLLFRQDTWEKLILAAALLGVADTTVSGDDGDDGDDGAVADAVSSLKIPLDDSEETARSYGFPR